MTDDTETAEREDEAPAASLPLIDTFAALEAELAAKEDRIERLENELGRTYLDPVDSGGEPADADSEPTDTAAEQADATADAADPAEAATTDDQPRSHEDWEPATDPLNDTGAVKAAGDQSGAANSGSSEGDSGQAEPDPRTAADDSGLQPVRTAGNRSGQGEPRPTSADSSASNSVDASTEREFGVTMEASSNLTGGSLGSSASGERASRGAEQSASDAVDRPDPTADRGERLSLLARRAELRSEEAVVETFVSGIEAFDDVTRGMLAHYREVGDAAPVDAHVAAGGSGERQYAYARNRTLRKAGVIEHDGAGRYRYALPSLVAEAFDGSAAEETLADAVAAIESATGLAE